MPPRQRVSLPALYRLFGALLFLLLTATILDAHGSTSPHAPVIKKVEPPNWWIGLTPDVMVLLAGKNLQATHANCNLADVLVSRTQSSLNGNYLFVWLRFTPELKSG